MTIMWNDITRRKKNCHSASSPLLASDETAMSSSIHSSSKGLNTSERCLEALLAGNNESVTYRTRTRLDSIELAKYTQKSNNQQDKSEGSRIVIGLDSSCNSIDRLYADENAKSPTPTTKSAQTVTFNLGSVDEDEETSSIYSNSAHLESEPQSVFLTASLSPVRTVLKKHRAIRVESRLLNTRSHWSKKKKKKMNIKSRSSSHPEHLHLIVDETAENNGDDRNIFKKYENGDVRRTSLTQSLPQSLEDVCTDNMVKCRFDIDEDASQTNSRQHSTNDLSETNLWSHRPTEFRLRDQLFSFFQASDNKLAMKLFGSRNALLKEKQRQIAARSWIIHPCSNFRLYWDLLMLIFLVTNLVVLPVSIAFFYDDVGVHWIVFNITCDTMFILDIIINFRTGLIDNESHGNIILDPKVIALRYLKSWFIIDFVSSLPLDYVFLGIEGQFYSAGRALRILRLAKLLQLLRLLRISRLVRYVRLWQEFFSLASIVVKLFNLICIMVLMGHWSGCIQFFVPVIQGLPEDSWIVIDQIQHAHWWEQYTKALFKALSHMLCIGYGQHPPRNMTDTWLTIGSMLAGATCYALFIGHATTLIQSFDTSSRQFRDHLQQVNEYMIYRKLPTDLRRRITDFYDHRFGGKMFDEAAILSEVSASLRKDVIYHNCRELIKNVPFFVNADNSFVMDVITKLEFEMFQPGDIIIKGATKGDRMFFIQEGLIEIVTLDGKIVTRLGDGSYFGEISLLTQQLRVATVRAAAYCNLFSLSKQNFDKILENYPLMRRTLETVAAKRLHTLGIDPSLVTSRESLLDDVNGIQKVFQTTGSDSEALDDDDGGSVNSHSTSRESNSHLLTVVKGFFTKDSEEFSPSTKLLSHRITSASENKLPRCKSTINHLVLVPKAAQGFTRRVKSTADVPNYDGAEEGLQQQKSYKQLTSEPPKSKSSTVLSSKKENGVTKTFRSRAPSPSPINGKRELQDKRRESVSQPCSPERKARADPIMKPPEVRITSHSDSSSDFSDDEGAKINPNYN